MTKITNATHWVWFKDLHPFTNPIWVRFRANYQMENFWHRRNYFHINYSCHMMLIVAGTCTPRYVIVHTERLFFLSFFLSKLLVCLSLLLKNFNSLTDIEGIKYPVPCKSFATNAMVKLREQIWFWKVCLPLYSPDNRLSEMKRKFKATGLLHGLEAANIESKNCSKAFK